ncbi:MAG TPA: polysaccharide deacetylase family protein [Chryseolinea sp.]|nr:polysaccharide deacetylase family protein [Chryseolinea sp.]
MKWILFVLISFTTLGIDYRSISKNQTKNNKEVVCFIYHRFGDSRYPSTNVSVEDFETHLKYLVENDFHVLKFSEAITYLRSDQPSKKTVVITIDDGYKSFFKNALPLLKKYKIPATLFVNTETVGGGDYMTWDELKEVVRYDIEIGNHTHSHHYFLNLPTSSRYKTFKDEIELSQSIIKKKLDLQPIVFSYPYGEFDSEMKKIVKQAGFVAAAAQNSGVMHSGSDIFQCPRFPMSEAYSSIKQFVEKASMHALQISDQSPESFLLGEKNPPVLTLTLSHGDLNLKELQCFVQGGECEITVETREENTILSLRARKPIAARRRTLYTLTVRDKRGQWYWFSHLWINPDIR